MASEHKFGDSEYNDIFDLTSCIPSIPDYAE